MHFTGDISLGSIAIIVTLIGIAIKIGIQVGSVQEVARSQAVLIAGHAARLDKYEERLVGIITEVSRVVGRLEATQRRIEQNTGTRTGEAGHQG